MEQGKTSCKVLSGIVLVLFLVIATGARPAIGKFGATGGQVLTGGAGAKKFQIPIQSEILAIDCTEIAIQAIGHTL